MGGSGAIKTVGHSAVLGAKAAEGSRTPRRFAHLVSRAYRRQVLECGCPLPLFYRCGWPTLMIAPGRLCGLDRGEAEGDGRGCERFIGLSSEMAR